MFVEMVSENGKVGAENWNWIEKENSESSDKSNLDMSIVNNSSVQGKFSLSRNLQAVSESYL